MSLCSEKDSFVWITVGPRGQLNSLLCILYCESPCEAIAKKKKDILEIPLFLSSFAGFSCRGNIQMKIFDIYLLVVKFISFFFIKEKKNCKSNSRFYFFLTNSNPTKKKQKKKKSPNIFGEGENTGKEAISVLFLSDFFHHFLLLSIILADFHFCDERLWKQPGSAEIENKEAKSSSSKLRTGLAETLVSDSFFRGGEEDFVEWMDKKEKRRWGKVFQKRGVFICFSNQPNSLQSFTEVKVLFLQWRR